ncbi:MAG: ribosome silencing factor [Phycisphaerales bacterium JB061]
MTNTDSSSTKSNTPQQRESARAFAIAAARSLTDSQCTETVVLDLKGKSPVADFLVITTGTSDRQMKSSADDVVELAPNTGHELVRQAADNRNTWIVSDFGDVVVHVFEPNTRAFYDLELLWGDASRVDWQRD